MNLNFVNVRTDLKVRERQFIRKDRHRIAVLLSSYFAVIILTSYLKEEVNCAESFLAVSVPCFRKCSLILAY
jgi:hypothetical protein